MKQAMRRHYKDFTDTEYMVLYELKLKDKPDQSAFRINTTGSDGKPILFKSIEIIKVPKMNNRFIVKLIRP